LQRTGESCIERIVNINNYFFESSLSTFTYTRASEGDSVKEIWELTKQLKDYFEFETRCRSLSARPEAATQLASQQTNSNDGNSTMTTTPQITIVSKVSGAPVKIIPDGQAQLEEGGGGGGGGEKVKTLAPKALRRKITIAENIRLAQLVEEEPLSALEHVVLSRVFNFYAEHSVMSQAGTKLSDDSESDSLGTHHGVLLSNQDLKELSFIQRDYVSINLENGSAGQDAPTLTRESTISTDDLEGTYLANHFQTVFFLLVKTFAKPFLDIKLADEETSNENSAEESPPTKTMIERPSNELVVDMAPRPAQILYSEQIYEVSNSSTSAQDRTSGRAPLPVCIVTQNDYKTKALTTEQKESIHGYVSAEARRLNDRSQQDSAVSNKSPALPLLTSPIVVTYSDCSPSIKHMLLGFDEDRKQVEAGTGGTSFPKWAVK
jgi:hypothetical protein